MQIQTWFFFKWTLLTIFQRLIILFNHINLKTPIILRDSIPSAQQGTCTAGFGHVFPTGGFLLTRSYGIYRPHVFIAKRKAGVQLHLCFPISRLDLWPEVFPTANKKGNSAVSGQINGLLWWTAHYREKVAIQAKFRWNKFFPQNRQSYVLTVKIQELSLLSPHHRNIILLIQHKITFNEKCWARLLRLHEISRDFQGQQIHSVSQKKST